MHTIKPLDSAALIDAAVKTGCVVTAEEHQINGGLGGAVAECLAMNCPVPMEMVGAQDTFGESGQPQELLDKYGMNALTIAQKAKKVLGRKNH